MTELPRLALGRSVLRVPPICLGTMTFGQQVDAATACSILDRALERGVDFIDTAEMYSVPTRRETYGATERIIGDWFASRPEARDRVVLATKVAGPSRNMDWVRNGSTDLTAAEIVQACDASLERLQTDRIDLYQIHWPNRNVPMFGGIYFDPTKESATEGAATTEKPPSSIQQQLEGLATLVDAGKVRAVGLSNETPWGVAEFLRVAARHGLPRIATVQNPYALVSRAVDNGLDELLWREEVSLLAYSPLAFGTLTGKYDAAGLAASPPPGRLALFDSMKAQRWGRPDALAAAKRYNTLARDHGLDPTVMALAFCYTSWRIASTVIGVTTLAQLDADLDAWGTILSPELLAAIDAIRWTMRDPAQ